MLFRSACPTSALVAWCRALKHGLGVGLLPGRVFRQQAKSGPAVLRPVAERIADRLESGDSLSEALQPEVGRFPVLFVETVAVGEQSGRLSDVLGELETHYAMMQTMRRRLITSLAWPAFEYVAAIGVITIMIAVLGMVGSDIDPLGFGLTGFKGAVIFLAIATAFTLGIVGVVVIVANDENLTAKAQGLAMGVPVLSGCVRAFALQRFSIAWHFLAEAGMKADRIFSFALRSTANRAYRVHETVVGKRIRKGQTVPDVMEGCGRQLFPEEYVESVRMGDETGQLSEIMLKQAENYRDESERKIKVLTVAATILVFMSVGGLIIFMIFRLAMFYFGMIDKFADPNAKLM